MKKIYTLIAAVLVTSIGFAQNAPVDFEAGGNGASWTWTVFENDDNPAVEIIDNPDASGINTSAKVAGFTARVDGNPWAGCETQHGSDIGSFTLTPSTSMITIMVWKSTISDVGIKLVEADGASLGEIKKANTKTNEWELIEFDFSAAEGIEYDQIVVFPDYTKRAAESIVYFDNITFGAATPDPVPTMAAATPTRLEADVISIFSDAYASKPVDTYKASWSQAIFSEVNIEGNPTIKYDALNFVGIETTGDNLIDATEMDTFHLDVWTPNANVFKVQLVDFGADMAFDGGDDTKHELVFDNLTKEAWNSLDLPLADFVNLTNRDHIAQIVFAAEPTGESTVYIDNIYFSARDKSSNKEVNALNVQLYPNPATNEINVKVDAPIEQISLINAQGKIVYSEVLSSSSNNHRLSTKHFDNGLYFITVKTANQTITSRINILK